LNKPDPLNQPGPLFPWKGSVRRWLGRTGNRGLY
jgi:hypothetical protein